MNTNELQQQLLTFLLQQSRPEQLHQALQQLLSPSEYQEIAKRLQIIRLLQQGMPQRQIAQQLGVGIATVSRGARALAQRPKQSQQPKQTQQPASLSPPTSGPE